MKRPLGFPRPIASSDVIDFALPPWLDDTFDSRDFLCLLTRRRGFIYFVFPSTLALQKTSLPRSIDRNVFSDSFVYNHRTFSLICPAHCFNSYQSIKYGRTNCHSKLPSQGSQDVNSMRNSKSLLRKSKFEFHTDDILEIHNKGQGCTNYHSISPIENMVAWLTAWI